MADKQSPEIEAFEQKVKKEKKKEKMKFNAILP